jgi:hypothetical protein
VTSSRRRLVRDQQLRPAGERDRDRDALPHAARELVRIRLDRCRGVRQAHLVEQLHRAPLGGAVVEPEVALHVLGELPADRQHRVERREWILEDHRQVAAGDVA